MQVAIDNAKRRFDIDLTEEIQRIKNDMDIKTNGYPVFWGLIRPKFNKNKINTRLQCPMNYIYGLRLNKYKDKASTLPMEHFFVKHEMTEHKRKSRKVEELIQKYSLALYDKYQKPVSEGTIDDETLTEHYLLLRNDFDKLIEDIHQITISSNYLGMMSWLINRAFSIGSGVRGNRQRDIMKVTIEQNKAILLKTLYEVSPKNFLKCFTALEKVDTN